MYDLAIIGSGPAGIAAAKAAQDAKLKTLLIEKEKNSLGGTCLNSGCIPTKFFLNSSKANKTWKNTLAESKSLIQKIKAPLLSFLEKSSIDLAWGQAKFLSKNSLEIMGKKIEAKNIIIASGSKPKNIQDFVGDRPACPVIVAEELFSREVIGDKILIVGGGYIGIEIASLLNSFGKDIYLIEKEKNILPFFDKSLSIRLRIFLQKKGIKIDTNKDLNSCSLDDFDLIISAVGRSPCLDELEPESAGLIKDGKGWIKTDSFLRTNVDNIYACGDITGKKLLAYTSEYQAKLCIDNIMGKDIQEDYSGVAECVFSIPSLAKVGILEQEAKEKVINYKIKKANFLKYSSSYVYNDTEGFIQIVLDENERISGAGIISSAAGELISIFSLCIKNNLGIDSLRKCLFIHPTLSEIIPLLAGE